MEDIPQGGAGGVPLDDTDQKHPVRPPAGEDEPDTGEEGDATTAEPGRSRRLDPEETTEEEGEQPSGN
ncbi:hypothetical protein ACFVGM_11295 [Kitasatospora purpeofusca]|uniref:hypothetical protein n=1 Tax=Kitasatospora purpeofusca TaxID=67352 RepID=UPI00369EEEAC